MSDRFTKCVLPALMAVTIAFSSTFGVAPSPRWAPVGSTIDRSAVSFWKFPKSGNVVRMEELPNGEMRFWAHQLDPGDEPTRKALATRGLEIDVKQMSPEYVLRFCGFGYDNGLKYMEIESKPKDPVFQVVVAIGFDFFRGVEHPKYGDTRWRIKAWRPSDNTLRIEGRLIGWRGLLSFGQIKDEVSLTRLDTSPPVCAKSPIYPVKPAPPTVGGARKPK